MAMTGGTAKLVHTGYGQYGNTNFPIKVYVYYKTSTNSSTLKSTITCGMYVTTPSGWDIGSWYDSDGSYVGTTGLTFNGEIPNFSGTRWLVENKSFTVNHNATTGTASATIYWKWGVNSPWGQCVYPSGSFTITLPTITTACTAPTVFTITPDKTSSIFESTVKFNWSGAKGGINNAINKYLVRYRTSSDNKTWSGWSDLGSKAMTTSSGSSARDMSAKVSRGHYVQFAIRTQGTAGSSYYSGWTFSNAIQRQPYTPCNPPSTFTATPNPFEDTVKFSWSGASGGISNAISSYYIQYSTTQDNITWDDWVGLKTVTSTSASGSYSVDMSSKVLRGKNVRFRIRTQGSAGSSFYSGYKTYSYITRQAYTKCEPPVDIIVTDTNPDSTSTFEIALAWSGAKSGVLNTISSYCIWYATSSNNSTWNSWKELTLVSSTTTSGNKSFDMTATVNRGEYVKFRIQVQGSAGSSFYSDYKETSSIRRNPYTNCSAPTSFQIISDRLDSSKTYNEPFETKVTLKWQGAISGASNTISGYDIYCAINESTNSNLEWNYQLLTSVASTKTEGTQELNMISLVKSINATLNNGTTKVLTKVPRTYYVRFQIVTKGSANSLYYSDKKTATYVQSNGGTTFEIRRNPYTVCLAPSTITLKSEQGLNGNIYNDVFESQILVDWSGASSGKDDGIENNPIKGYTIDYRISDDNQQWGNWITDSTLAMTGTSCDNCEIKVATKQTQRGQYVQFRIKTLGIANGFDSDYAYSTTMRKNSIPSNISSINANLEYSYDDGLVVSWSKPNDIDNNIYKYEVVIYQNANDEYIEILTTEVTEEKIDFNINNYEAYKRVKNNQQVQFAVKPIDVFGVSANEYKESSVITRYDDTGVCIGINGQWIPCQFYVCIDGQWVEQTVSAGVNSGWSQCGVE